MYFTDLDIALSSYDKDANDQTFRELSSKFNLSINHVVRIFLDSLGTKPSIGNLSKLNIILGPKNPKENRYWAAEGVGNFYYDETFHLKEFISLSQENKEEKILGIIVESFTLVLSEAPEEMESVLTAADLVRELKYRSSVELKISKTSPSRKYRAKVILTYKPGGYELSAQLIEKNKVIEKYVLDNLTYEYKVYQQCHKSKWIDDEFHIYGRDGSIIYSIKIK
jgi:hypothetical protein